MTRLTLALLLLLAPAAWAQTPEAPPAAPAPPAVPAFVPDQNARETRQQLREVLGQLPPSVGQVLALDPSLLNQPDYISAYPSLVAFVAQHPDVRRNPAFYFGDGRFEERDPRERLYESMTIIAGGFAGLAAFVAFLLVLTWVIRQLIDYRRWNRVTRTQTEVHTKLLDRLTNNEDLMAYMQTPAGRRFLESTPIPLDNAVAPPVAAPLNRILWSIQVGVILVTLGIGFWVAQGSIIQELRQLFSVIGTVSVALGVGFVISAAVSYLLSARLGLLESARQAS